MPFAEMTAKGHPRERGNSRTLTAPLPSEIEASPQARRGLVFSLAEVLMRASSAHVGEGVVVLGHGINGVPPLARRGHVVAREPRRR